MRNYEFSYTYMWHTKNIYDEPKKHNHVKYFGGRFEDEATAMKCLRETIISDLEKLDEIDSVRNGIVIHGYDKDYNEMIDVFKLEVKELPVMHYIIIWDDEFCCDSSGKYETLEEAMAVLHGNCVDSEIELAVMDNLNIEIEWDYDDMGFMLTEWSGNNKDEAEQYFERTYRIHELDEDENVIDCD